MDEYITKAENYFLQLHLVYIINLKGCTVFLFSEGKV